MEKIDFKKQVLSILSSNIAIKDKKITFFALSEPFNWLYQDMFELAPQKQPSNRNFWL